MARLTKRVREQAALICAVAASTPELSGNYGTCALRLGIRSARSRSLAYHAWRAVADHRVVADEAWMKRSELWSEIDAEAEALLRSGWSPR